MVAVIGVIGPADTTQLAVSVAVEMGLGNQVVARSYEVFDEAPALAVDLDRICRVLLFTGRVPYDLSRRLGTLQASLQFVPHSGADLYRTIVTLLREFGGELPNLSLDTVEPAMVNEAFEDLGLDRPRYVLALDEGGERGHVQPAEEITAFHLDRYRAGEVAVCVTCIGSVFRALEAEGVRAYRISHTRSVLREALRQAELAARLALTEATQPAVALIQVSELRPSAISDGGSYEMQRRRLRMRETVLDFAQSLQGRLIDSDAETMVVYTDRGTVEAAVWRLTSGHVGPLDLERLPRDARVGVGLGPTIPAAETSAQRALSMSVRDGDLHVVSPDGQVFRAGRQGPPATFKLRETDELTLRVAEELGLGPLALARLTRALRQVDSSSVTAAELASAYGIEARSARRLMTSLQRAGIATKLGSHGGTGAGRPQAVYRIDMGRLIPAEARDGDA